MSMSVMEKCVAVAKFIDRTRDCGWEGVGKGQDNVDSNTIIR